MPFPIPVPLTTQALGAVANLLPAGSARTCPTSVPAEQSATTETSGAAALLLPAVDRPLLPRVQEVRPPRHRGEKRPRLVGGLRQVGRLRLVQVCSPLLHFTGHCLSNFDVRLPAQLNAYEHFTAVLKLINRLPWARLPAWILLVPLVIKHIPPLSWLPKIEQWP